ncbi:MAG: FAD:protein FMN transferase [Actinomycetota bacterium]
MRDPAMLTREEVREPIRRSFGAMGTRVTLIAAPGSDPRVVARETSHVERIFAREEARFSRFRPESELCRVNARAGTWVSVSPPFATLVRRALEAADETDGLFDPTVLPALRAAGYDRDFKEIRANDRAVEPVDDEVRAIRREFHDLLVKDATSCGAWRDVEVRGDRVRIPEGAELDFGGIAKGWTVDLAAEAISNLPWAIVDAGGDLRIVGTVPDEGLDVGVEDPESRGVEALRLRLADGALATTSVTVRAWGPGAHHVIDPRTALPALTGVLQATVWAETCTQAEVWSKAALLTGPAILDRVPASLVLGTGEIVTSFGTSPVEQSEPDEVGA